MREQAPPPLLGGAPNFRAIAPFPAADGRRLKPNTLYRSGELSRLNATDLGCLAQLGIRLVCDLRSQAEQTRYLSRWPEDSRHRRLDLPGLDGTDASPAKIFALILRDPTPRGARLAMDTLYRRKPRAYAPQLGRLFSSILQESSLPLLIHCHAGKDRTGFFTAMLLAAAGISRENILADYVATGHFFAAETEAPQMAAWAERAFGQALDIPTALPLAEARPEYLQAAFAAIDDEFGGMTSYLTEAVGLSAPALRAFRDLVLE
ncbi:tyrosine-protein phosphatase [Acidocella sp.]|jgi:protein-tyrosine phosphatase|uniref:tyrosine-protein phosphatase n=1 Tax=Acidocella sp. TaxID=50710 RepID=UPI002F40CE50